MRDTTIDTVTESRPAPPPGAAEPAPKVGASGRSFAAYLRLLIIAGVVPPLVLAAILGGLWVTSEQRAIGREAVEMAGAMAERADREVSGLIGFLAAVASMPVLREGNVETFADRLAITREASAGYLALASPATRITLRDAGGQALAGGDGIATAEAMAAVLAPVFGEDQPVVSGMVTTPEGPAVVVAVPTAAGATEAALVAEIPLPALASLLGDVPEQWITAIFDREGMTLARSVDPGSFVGNRGREDIIAAIAAEGRGTMANVSRENIPLLNAFDTSQITEWGVVVGVPRSLVAAPFWRAALGVGAIVFALAVLGAALILGVLRRLGRSMAATTMAAERIGAGEAVAIPPSGIRELDRIGDALTEAAGRLAVEKERQKALLGELAHRINNLISVIGSLVQRTLSGDRSLAEGRDVLLKRLKALSNAHSLLVNQNWRQANLADIVETELAAFSQRATASGPDVALNPRAAQSFAMTVHELATNALRHGALSAPAGYVDVRWELAEGGGRLRFHWQERGGPPVTPPGRAGFGSALLRRAFGGPGEEPQLTFAAEGFSYRLDVDMAGLRPAPGEG